MWGPRVPHGAQRLGPPALLRASLGRVPKQRVPSWPGRVPWRRDRAQIAVPTRGGGTRWPAVCLLLPISAQPGTRVSPLPVRLGTEDASCCAGTGPSRWWALKEGKVLSPLSSTELPSSALQLAPECAGRTVVKPGRGKGKADEGPGGEGSCGTEGI